MNPRPRIKDPLQWSWQIKDQSVNTSCHPKSRTTVMIYNHLCHKENICALFYAAVDGNVQELKRIFGSKPKHEVERQISVLTSCVSTPLIIACTYGHLDVVEYLLKDYQADVEQTGVIKFDSDPIMGASPLWCAAESGNLNLVKMLVKYKAQVNSPSTEAGSTPLFVAASSGYWKIVKYLIKHGADPKRTNRDGQTCFMTACCKGHTKVVKYLLRWGEDVNRRGGTGKTALHCCAQAGDLESVEFLLGWGAQICKDDFGDTPLLSAARACRILVVKYFCDRNVCTKMEKIDAIELLGATYMNGKLDGDLAMCCWKWAMALRFEDSKCSLQKPDNESHISLYLDAKEARTFDELKELSQNPERMKMEALLIRHRILGPRHPDTVHYIKDRGRVCGSLGQYEMSIRLWMYALDLHEHFQGYISQETQSCLRYFINLLLWSMRKTSCEIPFQDISLVLRRALIEIDTALKMSQSEGQDLSNNHNFHCTIVIAMNLMGLLCTLKTHLNKDEEMSLENMTHSLVSMNPKAMNGFTPLHVACFQNMPANPHSVIIDYLSRRVVNLLLKVGACPNAVDLDKNTSLHIAALSTPCDTVVFRSLLDHGAHLDACNSKNQTPLQLVRDNPELDICFLTYINLQCMCAQVINAFKIPYKGLVRGKMYRFIESHCSH